jgi:chemotaxis protein MotB
MQVVSTAILAVIVVALASCTTLEQPPAPHDSVSRMLNEMKAKPRPVPPVADPRDARIASLEKQVSDLEAELGRLRGTAENLSDANRRVSKLDRQLADRDRELTSLRSSAGDAARLASQLSSAQGDLAQSQARVTDLEGQLAAAQLAAAGLQAGAADKDKLAAELATAKQQSAELEARLAAAQSSGADRDKLVAELGAAKQRLADLEKQLSDRDKELAGLRGELSAEMAKLKEAQRGLIRALRPQIEKKVIAVDLNNERLLIHLASGYLFGSGEDELKPTGAEALKQVGAILKDFPEYKVAVDGHTDNRPIRSALKKRFPSNKELSEARAANAAKALAEGGLSGASVAGYADTRPVALSTTDAGRAQNRRVEVRVTR